jgi:hypothetical protein
MLYPTELRAVIELVWSMADRLGGSAAAARQGRKSTENHNVIHRNRNLPHIFMRTKGRDGNGDDNVSVQSLQPLWPPHSIQSAKQNAVIAVIVRSFIKLLFA